MKKAPVAYLIALLGAFFIPGITHADISQYVGSSDGANAYYVTSGSAYSSQRLGAGFSGDVTQIAVPFFKTAGTGSWTASIECFTDDFYLTSCGQSATSTTGSIATGGAGAFSTTTISAYTLLPSRTYMLHVAFTVSGGAFAYLDASNLNSWTGGDAVQGTASVTGTVTDLAFNLAGSGFFGPTNGVSFGDISTTSVTGGVLFGDGASSTLDAILSRCGGTGNVFSEALCATFSYLFVPDPTIMGQYADLPALIETKFPFSYVAGVGAAFGGLTASSTANMISPQFAYHTVYGTIASTSAFGNFLPDVTILSSSTIETYITPTQWAFFQSLIAFGLWLALAYDIFFTVRDKMHRV